MQLGSRERRILGLVGLVIAALVWWFVDQGPSDDDRSGSSGGSDSVSGLPWIAEGELPDEAQATLDLIDDGGPFPYERDGITFENREEILPDRERGYYHEYTVDTPGSEDRGARRIVTGDGDGDEFYWTEDHYESFERIDR